MWEEEGEEQRRRRRRRSTTAGTSAVKMSRQVSFYAISSVIQTDRQTALLEAAPEKFASK